MEVKSSAINPINSYINVVTVELSTVWNRVSNHTCQVVQSFVVIADVVYDTN